MKFLKFKTLNKDLKALITGNQFQEIKIVVEVVFMIT